MKYLFSHWPEISARLRAASGIFLALDYDGVLAPIAVTPGLARMPLVNRRLLRALAHQKKMCVAIVSGRALDDVRQRVGIRDLIYAGNHGAEIALGGKVERHIPLQDYREHLVKAREGLGSIAACFPGAYVEDKGFGVGFHYRGVEARLHTAAKQAFRRWAKGLPAPLKVTLAKMLFEIRPNFVWNKGSAVKRIWQQIAPNALPICLGDDKTDEDGFIALRGKGINIFVGVAKRSAAEYFLNSTEDVTQFLKQLQTDATRHFKRR